MSKISEPVIDKPASNSDVRLPLSLPTELRHRIANVFAPDYVDTWWLTHQPRFGNLSPQELFLQGKQEVIERALSRIEQGITT